MDVILTEKLCGKTSIKNPNYIDFDFFNTENLKNKSFFRKFVKYFVQQEDIKDKVLLINVRPYMKLFQGLSCLNIVGIYLPENSDISLAYRRSLLMTRDLEKFGVIRTKLANDLGKYYLDAYSYVLNHFPDLKIHTLGVGEFLQDKLP